jgi:hypothetical protein
MLRRSRLLSHMTRSCTASAVSLLVASFGRPGRSSSSMLSMPLLNSAGHFLTVLYEGDSFPSVSWSLHAWSLHEFPWGTSISYRGPKWRLWFQLSPFGLNETPLYWSKYVLFYLPRKKPRVTRSVIFNKISVSNVSAVARSLSSRELLDHTSYRQTKNSKVHLSLTQWHNWMAMDLRHVADILLVGL